MSKYKYSEDKILKELNDYIEATYGEHYASDKLQTIDVWEALGIEVESCQSNVVKYAMRYGKKDGYNKKDLMKILHYTILWWHFTQDNIMTSQKDSVNKLPSKEEYPFDLDVLSIDDGQRNPFEIGYNMTEED